MHSERLAYIEKLNDEQELSVSDVAELIDTIKRLAGHSRLLGAKEFHALERARSYIDLTYNEEGGEEAAEAKHDLDQFDAVMRVLGLAMEAPDEQERRQRLVEEYAIVDRVWKALGITSYEQARGKAIDELVAEAVEKAWRYDQLSK